jgi:hypothetical protein
MDVGTMDKCRMRKRKRALHAPPCAAAAAADSEEGSAAAHVFADDAPKQKEAAISPAEKKKVIKRLASAGEFLEIRARFGESVQNKVPRAHLQQMVVVVVPGITPFFTGIPVDRQEGTAAAGSRWSRYNTGHGH